MTVQQRGNEALLVNAHGNGLTDCRVLNDAACHVHRAKECAGGLNAGELIIVVFKVGIRLIRHTVGGVNVPGLQRRRERVAVGKRADGQLVDLRRAVPVGFILRQCQMIVRDHFLHDIGTRANHDAGIKITCIHINDAAVGVAQIVHECRIWFAGGNGERLAIGMSAILVSPGARSWFSSRCSKHCLTASASMARPLENVTLSCRIIVHVRLPSFSHDFASHGSSSMLSV